MQCQSRETYIYAVNNTYWFLTTSNDAYVTVMRYNVKMTPAWHADDGFKGLDVGSHCVVVTEWNSWLSQYLITRKRIVYWFTVWLTVQRTFWRKHKMDTDAVLMLSAPCIVSTVTQYILANFLHFRFIIFTSQHTNAFRRYYFDHHQGVQTVISKTE